MTDHLFRSPRIFTREEIQEAADRELQWYRETGHGKPIVVYGDKYNCSHCGDSGWVWVDGVYCNHCDAGPALEASEHPS